MALQDMGLVDASDSIQQLWRFYVNCVHIGPSEGSFLTVCMEMVVTVILHRCIDKAGGLDNYLMNTPEKKLASDVGMALRKQIDYWQRKNKQIESEAPASENESQNQAADSVDSK